MSPTVVESPNIPPVIAGDVVDVEPAVPIVTVPVDTECIAVCAFVVKVPPVTITLEPSPTLSITYKLLFVVVVESVPPLISTVPVEFSSCSITLDPLDVKVPEVTISFPLPLLLATVEFPKFCTVAPSIVNVPEPALIRTFEPFPS